MMNHGMIGYAEFAETTPGVFREQITERPMTGDVNRSSRRWQSADGLNDNLTLVDELSVVGDAYAYEHYHMIRYAVKDGIKWKVVSVEKQHPRLILTLGGLYNEQQG